MNGPASVLICILIIVALTGSAVVAGVFFAFSNFVMKALAEIPYRAGVSAMQSINIVVINPVFLGLFIGEAVLAFGLAVLSLLQWEQAYAQAVLIGASFYFIGTFFVTIAGNIPLNEKLAPMSVENTSAPAFWNLYLTTWTKWNHVRTIAALVATVFYTHGLIRMIGDWSQL